MFVQGGGGWSDKTPRQKYRAFQAYRTFLSREPPKALGSKEIPQVRCITLDVLYYSECYYFSMLLYDIITRSSSILSQLFSATWQSRVSLFVAL